MISICAILLRFCSCAFNTPVLFTIASVAPVPGCIRCEDICRPRAGRYPSFEFPLVLLHSAEAEFGSFDLDPLFNLASNIDSDYNAIAVQVLIKNTEQLRNELRPFFSRVMGDIET